MLNARSDLMANQQDVVRKILGEIDRDPAISQKRLADEVGISVGMINWHLKRCVSKGLVKLKQAPIHRYLYYLTPQGFSEKSRLTGQYWQTSLDIFRQGREQYLEIFENCVGKQWSNIVLIGSTELTELALMVAAPIIEIKIVAVVANSEGEGSRRDVPVVCTQDQLADLAKTEPIDALVVCHFSSLDSDLPFSLEVQCLSTLELDEGRLFLPEFLQ